MTMKINLSESGAKPDKKTKNRTKRTSSTPLPPAQPIPPQTPQQQPPSPIFVPQTPELIKLEELLNNVRREYAEEYKKFLAERKKKTFFAKNAWRLVMGSTVEDSEIPPSLKKLEERYNAVAVAYGNRMLWEKETELAGSTLSQDERDNELKRYKQNEIFTRVIIQEQSMLNATKAENLPPKEKGIVRKGMEWYLKQPRWKKLLISTALGTSVIALVSSSTVAAAGGVTYYAGLRLTRAAIGAVAGQGANIVFDRFVKEKSAAKRAEAEEELAKIFETETFDTSLARSKKEYAEILERERKAKRNRLITKAMIGLAAGVGASFGMGYGVSHLSHSGAADVHAETETSHEDPLKALHDSNVAKMHAAKLAAEAKALEEVRLNSALGPLEPAPAPETSVGPISGEEIVSRYVPHAPEGAMEPIPLRPSASAEIFTPQGVTFSHGKGAIQAVLDLRAQLRETYHGDYSHAPKGVQEFMTGKNAATQAVKLGLFSPDNPSGEESSLVGESSVLGFDEHGNLSIHDTLTNKNFTLIHGDTGDVEKYTGQMFDSDHSADVVESAHTEAAPASATTLPPDSELPPEDISTLEPTPKSIHSDAVEEARTRLTAKYDATLEPEIAGETVNIEQLEALKKLGYTGSSDRQSVDEFIRKLRDGSGTTTLNQVTHSSNIIHEMQTHPEFLENHYHLNNDQLAEVYETSQKDLDYMFRNRPLNSWERLKDLKATAFTKGTGVLDPASTRLRTYFNYLQRFSGIKPKTGFLGMGAETSEHYMIRALQKLASGQGKVSLEIFEEELRR